MLMASVAQNRREAKERLRKNNNIQETRKREQENKHIHRSIWGEVERDTQLDQKWDNKRAAESAEGSLEGQEPQVREEDTQATDIVYLK